MSDNYLSDISANWTAVIAKGIKPEAKHWNNATINLDLLKALGEPANHKEGPKDGKAFLQGSTSDGRRTERAMSALHIIGIDIDDGTPIPEIEARIQERKLAAAIYSTHSHRRASTVVRRDDWIKFQDANPNATPADYLKTVKRYRPEIADGATVEDAEQTSDGLMVRFNHAPMDKCRAVFVLGRIWRPTDWRTHDDAIRGWKRAYAAFCRWLNVNHDTSCEDPSRLFYAPRHEKDAPVYARWMDGSAVDIFALPGAADAPEPTSNAFLSAAKAMGAKGRSGDAHHAFLTRWAAMGFASRFEIADVIERHDPDRFRPERDSGDKRHIQCPFEAEHGTQGGHGTFVLNASHAEKDGFKVHCRHHSCESKGDDRDRLHHLAKMIEDGWFPEGVLFDPDSYFDTDGLDFSDLEAIRDGKPTQRRDKVTGRRVLYVSDDWPTKVDGSLEALAARNTPPKLFKFADRLSRVGVGDSGKVHIDPLDQVKLRREMMHAVQWLSVKTKKDGETVTKEEPAPLDVCQLILATPSEELRFPVLDGLAGTPFFTKGGKLHSTPGYDPVSRIYYSPLPGFSMPPVSVEPTTEEVKRAKGLLLDDVLCDFPFDGDAEKANAVAMILLPFVRNMIEGPTPLHWLDKPTPGTGASMLVNCVSLLSVGSKAEAHAEVSSDDEWRKKLTSALLAGSPLLFVDNINKRLDSGVLAGAVTAPRWNDRLLGSNTQVDVPVRCTFIIAGNNITMSSELLRRCVRIRLDAKMENPEKRTVFKHANLEKWITDHRGELVWACLTLVQNWVAKGMPAFSGAPLGSFSEWSSTLGGILEAAGVESFLANRHEVREKGDTDKMPVRLFLSAWFDTYREEPVTVSGKNIGDGLYDLACDIDPPLPLLTGEGDQRDRRRLGELLKAWRDQRYDIEPTDEATVTVAIKNLGDKNKAKVVQWALRVEAAA